MTNPPNGSRFPGGAPEGAQIVPPALPWKKRTGFFVRAVISAVLIWIVLRKIDWTVVGNILDRADWGLLCLAAILTPGLFVLLSVRWRIFILQQGILLRGKHVLFLTWVGQFFNAILPGSTGGDFFKIFQLCRIAHHHKAGAVASVVSDRFTALVALLVLVAFSFVRQPIPASMLRQQITLPLTAGVTVLALLAVAAGIILWRRFPSGHFILAFFDAMKLALRPSISLASGLAVSFAIHFFSFFLVFLFSRALGFSVTYSDTLIFLPVLLLLMMLPITVNGHGLRELVLIYYFNALSLLPQSSGGNNASEFVVSLSIMMVANELLWSLPGGVLYVIRYRGMR